MAPCLSTRHGSATPRCCTVLLACAALAGCYGGQTGGEFDGSGGRGLIGTPTSDAACMMQTRMLHVDEVSPLGFSANDVLAYATGTRSASLFWNANTAPASYGPESGQSRIELSLEYRGGAVRAQQFLPEGTGGAAPTLGCMADRLEIEVEASLVTAGGALDESFTALLAATSQMSAQLTYSFRLQALNGSFTVNVPAGSVVDQLQLDTTLNGAGFQGNLSGSVSPSSKDDPRGGAVGGPISVTLATWPSALSGQP